MATHLTTQELKQGSAGFLLKLNFELEGFLGSYVDQTWKVKIVTPDGTIITKTTGIEFEENLPKISVPIDDFDLILAGKYYYQVTLITGGANVNGSVESFVIEPSLPEGLAFSIISSAFNYFPIFTSGGALAQSTLKVNGNGDLEFSSGGGLFNGAVKVLDEAYGVLWNGSLEVPTKNAVYDKISSLSKTDIGMGNIDNTSDINKPISTATQTALNLKASLSGATFSGAVVVPDDAFSGSWDGSMQVPTKNAIYDYIQSAASTSLYLAAPDFRTGIIPNNFPKGKVGTAFSRYSNSTTGSFADALILDTWTDDTAGSQNLLLLNKAQFGMRIFQVVPSSVTKATTYRDVVLTENNPTTLYIPRYNQTSDGVTVTQSDIWNLSQGQVRFLYNSGNYLNFTVSSAGAVVIDAVGTSAAFSFQDPVSIATLTQGSVVFVGASGLLNQNNSLFNWDNTNIRLGIGVSSPVAGMHVVKTTEQQRIGYDLSNYYNTVVDNAGKILFDAVGSAPYFAFNDRVDIYGTVVVSSSTNAYQLFPTPLPHILVYKSAPPNGSVGLKVYLDGPLPSTTNPTTGVEAITHILGSGSNHTAGRFALYTENVHGTGPNVALTVLADVSFDSIAFGMVGQTLALTSQWGSHIFTSTGLEFANWSNDGSTTWDNSYVIKADSSVIVATNNWFLYVDADIPSYLKGKLGLGIASPTAKLEAYSTGEVLRLGYNTSNFFSTTVYSNGQVGFGATGSGANFYFNNSVTIANFLSVVKTTEQVRIGYDASNYYKTTVGSTGITTLQAFGSSGSFVFANTTTIQSILNLGTATPSIWGTYSGVIDGGSTSMFFGQSGDHHLVSNAYFNSGSWKYYSTGAAANQYMYQGVWYFRNAVSGTVGGNITWNDIITLGYNGGSNVGIGTTAPSTKLHVIGLTEQLRLGYNTSNYYSTTVSSTGGVTFDAVGSGASFTFSDPITVTGTLLSAKKGKFTANIYNDNIVEIQNTVGGFAGNLIYAHNDDLGSTFIVDYRARVYINGATGSASINVGDASYGLGAIQATQTGSGNLNDLIVSTQGTGGNGTYFKAVTAGGAIAFAVVMNSGIRVGYDNSNYYTSLVSSTGAVVFDATGSGASFNFADTLAWNYNSSTTLSGYANANPSSLASTTALNAGLILYNNAGYTYGLDLGCSSGGIYSARLFAPTGAAITFAFHANGTTPTVQNSFTNSVIITTGGISVPTAGVNYAEHFGAGSVAPLEGSLAVGAFAQASASAAINSYYATAIGYDAQATGSFGYSVAIGAGSRATGSSQGNIAIGRTATATTDGSVAIGLGANASGGAAFAMGYLSAGSGASAIAVGYQATASGSNSQSIGDHSTASNTYSIALGGSASSVGFEGIAIGGLASAGHSQSIALGYSATTTQANQFIIGSASAPITEFRQVYDTSNYFKTILSSTGVVTFNTVGSGASFIFNNPVMARINPRINLITSSSTPTPSADTDDQYHITALAANATFGAPTGTPVNGQKLLIRILDNGVAKTLAWNAIYRGIGLTLPTVTVAGKLMYVGLIYNSASSKWDVVSVVQE